jgi:hypothetical protein
MGVTIKLPHVKSARYDIAEIFDKVNSKAVTEDDAILILRHYKTPELMWFLKTMYSDVKWKLGNHLPRWVPATFEKGNTFSTIQHQLPRIKSLVEGAQPKMLESKARAVFLDVMEVIHKDEAKWLALLIRGKAEAKVKHMSKELVEKAFPDLLT